MSVPPNIELTAFRSSTLEADSTDQSFLYSAARHLLVDAPTLEIGLRRGGGTEAIVRGLVDGGRRGHTHLAIDPYGDIDYLSWEQIGRLDYTNGMRDEALPQIRAFCAEMGVNFIYMPMEDTEFFSRFSDGVPVYSNRRKTLAEAYGLVHFDGPHGVAPVLEEARFFASRCPVGAQWVFDNPEQYDHDGAVDPFVRQIGFELVHSGARRWYLRTQVVNAKPSAPTHR